MKKVMSLQEFEEFLKERNDFRIYGEIDLGYGDKVVVLVDRKSLLQNLGEMPEDDRVAVEINDYGIGPNLNNHILINID